MSGFVLKLIAIISMTMDHTGHVLFPNNVALRIIGRIAFPIFCYLIAEGFQKTHSAERYMLRLGIFALISEIPFDLAIYGKAFYWQKCNVFVTLFLGLSALYLYKKIRSLKKLPIEVSTGLALLAVALMCFTAHLLKTDYGYYGVMLIFIFYIFKDKLGIAFLLIFLLTEIRYGITSVPKDGYLSQQALLKLFTANGKVWYINRTTQHYAMLAAMPIGLYNGMRGYNKAKWMFYGFYPVHLMLLFIIKQCTAL